MEYDEEGPMVLGDNWAFRGQTGRRRHSGDTQSEKCDFGWEGIEESATDRSASERDREKSRGVGVW